MTRDDFATCRDNGKKQLDERLSEAFQKRINEYSPPDIAPGIVKDLNRYVQARTG
jgi:trimethylamine:corrinoid methyltransferase-like protein